MVSRPTVNVVARSNSTSQLDHLLCLRDRRTHPLGPSLRLAGWIISGNTLDPQVYRESLRSSFWHHGEKGLNPSILQPGDDRIAGVVQGVSIPFHHL